MGRALAKELEKIMDVPITYINKPGGGGIAGLQDFFMAPADGYTVVQYIDTAATRYVLGEIKENPVKEWFPICTAQIGFSQIYRRTDDNRFPNWDELVKNDQKNPGKIKMANMSAIGGMERITMHLLTKATGVEFNQISFDKPAERYGALIGEHVDTLFEQPGDVSAYLKSKDMKPILTLLHQRPDAFGDVQCLKDIGAEFEPLYRCRFFSLKKGVPTARVKYLEWAFNKAFHTDSFQKFNHAKYMDLVDSYRDMEGSIKLLKSLMETYRAVYKEIGLLKD
jgi:tripartite-type tricarboxylate transporter receptor subunit TctC